MKAFLLLVFMGPVMLVCGQSIIQAEYFLDADAGIGKNTLVNVTPAADGTFPFIVNLAGKAPGYHKLYIRTKDSNGKWSITTRRNIEILPANVQYKIVSGEYYFDTDPGFGAANTITVSPQDEAILQDFNAIVGGLSVGYHKLYGRFKDANGKWSQTFRRNVEIVNSGPENITLLEYFITQDPGVGKATRVNVTPFNDANTHGYVLKLPCLDANDSAYVYIRARDGNGNWSLTTVPVKKFALKDAATITTTKAGNWSDASTWSNNAVPNANTMIILNHDVIVDIDATCKYLFTFCHEVLVNTNKKLIVTGH